MADNNSEIPLRSRKFIPEYADQIAHAGNHWSYLEYKINSTIWALANVSPALGACITAQIYVMNARLNALVALLKLRQVDGTIIKKVNKFADHVRDAQEARNRIAHDMWLLDTHNPGKMGKMRVTADKTLKFDIEKVELEDIEADVEKIRTRLSEFSGIQDEITAVLPTLHEIPLTELHPIVESHSPPQNPPRR